MKKAHVNVAITKDALMEALVAMTVNDEQFDPRDWSIWNAEVLERAAALIRRTIADEDRRRAQVEDAARAFFRSARGGEES